MAHIDINCKYEQEVMQVTFGRDVSALNHHRYNVIVSMADTEQKIV
jgi:hypothetical protein